MTSLAPRAARAFGSMRMEQLPRVFEVAELAHEVKAVVEGSARVRNVWLRGEVCNLSHPSSGHYYFGLKDASAQLRCVLFRGDAERSPAVPVNGAAVVAHGSVRFYEAQGSCQLLVDLVLPQGMGFAEMQLQELRARLEADGVFDPSRKRSLPTFPRRIGIISSGDGAVIHDLIVVLKRRYPLGEVLFWPCQVQGEAAPLALTDAIDGLNRWRSPTSGLGIDVLVLARGGGAPEDLATFNDERLVRAVFASRSPIVSAVGHETDTTLADLAADVRAPTPSAAAEMLTPDLTRVAVEIAGLRDRAQRGLVGRVVDARVSLDGTTTRMQESMVGRLGWLREQLESSGRQLRALSPEATLARGYAIAERHGQVVREVSEVAPGDDLRVRLHRGAIETTVAGIELG